MHTLLDASSPMAWTVIVASGIFHGINPAMGWLFATALGMQRGSRTFLFAALPPLAIGHATSIFLIASSAAALNAWEPRLRVHEILGGLMIAWAIYHLKYGHRHRIRVGMTVGFLGLTSWSAAMATMHGAGLMLVPALLPLCTAAASSKATLLFIISFVSIHTAVCTTTTALVALLAYEILGLGVLRHGWINFEWLWCGTLVATGLALVIAG
jgi:phage baseplate assembly protein W